VNLPEVRSDENEGVPSMLKIPQIIKNHCIALTGGIATGKSFIRKILESELRVLCFDADQIAKEVFDQDLELRTEIINVFGELSITPEGQLNRAFIREQIINNELKRQRLNSITHPKIRKRFESLVEINQDKIQTLGFFIYEASLIVETSRQNEFREVWMSICSRKTQELRLQARDVEKNSESQGREWISKTLSSQIPPTTKALFVHRLISTEQTPDKLECTIKKAIFSLQKT
jgi:dephospho-CoA kinase